MCFTTYYGENSNVGRKQVFENRKIGARGEILYFFVKPQIFDSTVQNRHFWGGGVRTTPRTLGHKIPENLIKIVEKSSIFGSFCTFLTHKIGL